MPTLHFAIIGHPVQHSASAAFFAEKFSKEHIDADYQKLDIADVKGLRELIASKHLRGLNVTIPHKVAVIEQLDAVMPTAQAVGAVNVISVENGKLIGHNTDVLGFSESLKPLIGNRKKAIVLGTGGASKAVRAALEDLKVEFVVVSRNPSEHQIGYADITPALLHSHTLVVNATPLGMAGELVNEVPQLPYDAISAEHLIFDVVHTPAQTQFMKLAQEKGATVVGGRTMFVKQAEETWKIWQQI